MTTREAAASRIAEWRINPCKFVFDNFGVEPDAWQADALSVFARQDEPRIRISLQACAGPGKSAVLAWAGLNFLTCYADKGQHPKGAATAVTSDNLRDNLWAEFAKWREQSDLMRKLFEWNADRIYCKQYPNTWFISARTWSKKANPEEQGRTLSGLHSEFVIILIDESGEIPVSVLKAGEQSFSNCKFGRIIQAGNPTSLDGMLHAAANQFANLWHVIRITGDPDDSKRSKRIDVQWAKQQIELYGRDDPWVKSYILGLFPPASINALLSSDEVDAAMALHYPEEKYSHSQKRLGVDVARFGLDLTCLFPRQGLVAFQPVIMRHANTQDIAARIMAARMKWSHELEFIDDTGGYGAGVIDSLRQAGLSPVAVNASGKAIDPRYFNKRSECWLEMRDWIRRGGKLPKSPELKRDLTTPTYTFQNGKLRVEEKDSIKKRLNCSPDRGDSLSLTFSYPEMPGLSPVPYIAAQMQSGKIKSDWDPFSDERLNSASF